MRWTTALLSSWAPALPLDSSRPSPQPSLPSRCACALPALPCLPNLSTFLPSHRLLSVYILFANLSSPALNRRSDTPPRPAPRQPRATCPTSTSSASSWRVRPPWPRRGEGPAGARGGKTSSSLLRPLGSCDLQDRPPSGSMDTSMRWSPSLSAAPAEARFVRSRTSPPADRP